jgi:hypothetical protein
MKLTSNQTKALIHAHLGNFPQRMNSHVVVSKPCLRQLIAKGLVQLVVDDYSGKWYSLTGPGRAIANDLYKQQHNL